MLEIKKLSFGYQKKQLNLDRISFCCKPGECVAVLGNNGCGKTTLIKLIDRILPAGEGEILLGGEPLSRLKRSALAREIAYVAQENRPGRMTVFDAILLGRKPYIQVRAAERDYEVTQQVIRKLNLEAYAMRYTDELSGGEYQKVVLGRALAQEAKVLLLDEPTSNLDMRNQKEVLELVREVVRELGIIAVVIIHDVNAALRYCDHFIFLKDREVYASGGHESVTNEILSEVYGLPVCVRKWGETPVVFPE